MLESYLGFDRGLFLTASYLWDAHGVRSPLHGVVPSIDYWPLDPRFAPHLHRLPPFRFNCFVQAKRCFEGRRLPRRLSALGGRRPFFRFDVEEGQQRILDESARALDGRALFVYAAPVFGESSRLFHLQRIGQLVEHSTLPDVRTLAGHRAWYYNEPGANGMVNPDFEFLEGRTLGQRVAALIDGTVEIPVGSPSENLQRLAQTLRTTILEAGADEVSPRTAYLADDWWAIDSYAQQYELPRAARAFMQVTAFVNRMNLRWLVMGPRAE